MVYLMIILFGFGLGYMFIKKSNEHYKIAFGKIVKIQEGMNQSDRKAALDSEDYRLTKQIYASARSAGVDVDDNAT